MLLDKLIVAQPLKVFPSFLEYKYSLPSKQQSATCRYAKSVSQTLPSRFKIHFNIILQSTLKSFRWFVLFHALPFLDMRVAYSVLVPLNQYSTEVVRVAQMVETLHYQPEIVGSIPDGFIGIFH